MNEHNEHFMHLAAENLGRSLLEGLLQEIRIMPDVWQKLNEKRQTDVIERLQSQITHAVGRAVYTIAGADRTTLVGKLEQVTNKEKIKAVFVIDPREEGRHELSDTAAHDYLDGVDQVKADPDQHPMDLNGGDRDMSEDGAWGDGEDPLYKEAVQFVRETRRASISAVQRKLKIGYNRAARLIELMEQRGVVTAMNSNGSREVVSDGDVVDAEFVPLLEVEKFGGHTFGDVCRFVASRLSVVDAGRLQRRFAISLDDAKRLLIMLLDEKVIELAEEAEAPDDNVYRVIAALNDLDVNME